MAPLRRRIIVGMARTLALALILAVVPATTTRAQFGMGYGGMGPGGMGYYGMGPGSLGFGGLGMGYGGMGMGYGGMGYGGMGYGGMGYGGMGMGYGGMGYVGMGYGGMGYGGMGYGEYIPPGYSAGYVNPLFAVGLSPLGLQSALGGNFAPGRASYSRGYQVTPRYYSPGAYGPRR